MGNSQRAESGFDLANWAAISTNINQRLLRHRDSGQLVCETTLLFSDHAEVAHESHIYSKRSLLHNAVGVLGLNSESEGGLCSGFVKLKVYTEHLSRLLSEERDLQPLEGLKYLREALLGYQSIHKCYKNYFTVTPRMIGLDHSRNVRVWLSEDFASNYANEARVLTAPEAVSARIANRLFQLFKERIAGRTFPERLHQFAIESNLPTLDLASGSWLLTAFLRRQTQLSLSTLSEHNESASTWRSFQKPRNSVSSRKINF